MFDNDFRLPLVRLILDSLWCPRDHSVENPDGLVVGIGGAQSATELDFKSSRDLFAKPIKLPLLPEDREAISMNNSTYVAILVKEHMG